jgi:hypothetical protein
MGLVHGSMVHGYEPWHGPAFTSSNDIPGHDRLSSFSESRARGGKKLLQCKVRISPLWRVSCGALTWF